MERNLSMSQFLSKDDLKQAADVQATTVADELIAAEIARQGRMWGVERDDTTQGELQQAAFAQLDFLRRRQRGDHDALVVANFAYYPASWCGFRDYGSDVANLVVAVAYLRNEIARKIRAGESTERTSRNVVEQPYCELNQPNVIEP